MMMILMTIKVIFETCESSASKETKACSKCRATAVLNLNQFDLAVAQQWFQMSSLIQLRQILKYIENDKINPKNIKTIYEFSSARQ